MSDLFRFRIEHIMLPRVFVVVSYFPVDLIRMIPSTIPFNIHGMGLIETLTKI